MDMETRFQRDAGIGHVHILKILDCPENHVQAPWSQSLFQQLSKICLARAPCNPTEVQLNWALLPFPGKPDSRSVSIPIIPALSIADSSNSPGNHLKTPKQTTQPMHRVSTFWLRRCACVSQGADNSEGQWTWLRCRRERGETAAGREGHPTEILKSLHVLSGLNS